MEVVFRPVNQVTHLVHTLGRQHHPQGLEPAQSVEIRRQKYHPDDDERRNRFVFVERQSGLSSVVEL